MKLAISGKGGAGKSTVAAALALLMARDGRRCLAVDADPDANLAAALGIGADARKAMVPIAQHKALVEERTGAKIKQYGQMFKMNPEVSDIAERYAYDHAGVALLVLGAVDTGGSGCACPESVLLRALVSDLILHRDEALIMDMEAGVEHLGRATARGVDKMLVVVEPGQRSVDCALRVRRMAGEIGLSDVQVVANKVSCDEDTEFICRAIGDLKVIGSIPFSEDIRVSDRHGRSVLDDVDDTVVDCFRLILTRLEQEREL